MAYTKWQIIFLNLSNFELKWRRGIFNVKFQSVLKLEILPCYLILIFIWSDPTIRSIWNLLRGWACWGDNLLKIEGMSDRRLVGGGGGGAVCCVVPITPVCVCSGFWFKTFTQSSVLIWVLSRVIGGCEIHKHCEVNVECDYVYVTLLGKYYLVWCGILGWE